MTTSRQWAVRSFNNQQHMGELPTRILVSSEQGETVKVSEAGLSLIILENLLENATKAVHRKQNEFRIAKENLETAKKEHDKLVDQINNLKRYVGKM